MMEPDETEIEKMIEKGTKAWAGVPDNWVDELRGGPDMLEEFESWYMRVYGEDWANGLEKDIRGGYKYSGAREYWEIWQAAWKIAKLRETT